MSGIIPTADALFRPGVRIETMSAHFAGVLVRIDARALLVIILGLVVGTGAFRAMTEGLGLVLLVHSLPFHVSGRER